MAVGPIIAAAATILAAFLTILAGIVGWLVMKIWQIQNEEVANNTKRIASIEEQLRGVSDDDSDQGFTGMTQQQFQQLNNQMEEMHSLLEEAEEQRRQEHMEVRKALMAVIDVLHEHEDINGNLPDKEELEPSE